MVQYILKRSNGLYLGKDLGWTANYENNPLYHTEHQDIALNQLIELNAKDINLRAKLISCEISAKGKITILNIASNAA